jgi:hypothetical protein
MTEEAMMDRSIRPIALAATGAIMAIGMFVAPAKLDPAHGMSFQQAFAENKTADSLSLRERAYSIPAQGDKAAVLAYRAMPRPLIAPNVVGTLMADEDVIPTEGKAPIK